MQVYSTGEKGVGMWIFALFIAIPIVEIAVFIQVGGLIGLWPTIGLVILSAMLGMAVLRSQSGQAWREVQRNVAEMRDPSRPLAHGALILVAGFLLLLPGFLTDILGLLLLLPAMRDLVMRWLSSRIRVKQVRMQQAGYRREPHRAPYGDGVIDGDYVVEDEPVRPDRRVSPPDLPPDLPDDDPGPRRGSGWTRH